MLLCHPFEITNLESWSLRITSYIFNFAFDIKNADGKLCLIISLHDKFETLGDFNIDIFVDKVLVIVSSNKSGLSRKKSRYYMLIIPNLIISNHESQSWDISRVGSS